MKVPDRELKQKIIAQLSELPVYYPNRTNTQHVIRCTNCGDSATLSHAHLSIHIDVDDDRPMFYRCFRCNDSGMVTHDNLIDWGVRLDADDIDSLSIYNKKSKKKYKHTYSDNYEDFFNPEIPSDILFDMKMNYINSRLDSNFSYDEFRKLKVVLSLNEFYKANYLKSNITPFMQKQIENGYVGFLATNNNRIMFRNISSKLSKDDFRWYNVILNSGNLNPYTFYSIPNKIDLYYTDQINVHVAEGVFDILSIYHNMMDDNIDHNLYYASCGSSASNIMNFLIDRGINTGINLHLYADKDKSDRFHMDYLMKDSNLYQWCDKIIIHRNRYEGEKDYGVPKNKIVDSYRTVYRK